MVVCDIKGEALANGYELKKPCGQVYRVGKQIDCEIAHYDICRAIQKCKDIDKKIGDYK